ncbi:hypothetical protein H5410_030397 [Solanum commersonii]|uniref:Uncharacterized protein n=1 Tax=Solanum commersonii TaxID=4109 RepID=A0A9J5YE72_SOLCO|nr:hypothetical protein H5410_030397 [Solanum commersonii]
MHYLHNYTFEQRRQNWIIKNTSRPTGSIIDYVYNFVLHGEVRETKKKLRKNEETVQVTPRHKQHIRGSKLIKHYVVGTCTESSKGVYIKNRGDDNYLSEHDIPSNIGNKRKRENEDLYGHQQVNLENDAPTQSFFYLWDFELIHLQERSKEVFPIPDIDELQRVDPSIDLLSSFPKASGKSPREEDKDKNKSKKRKNVKRDHEKEDILEAQRRSKVDEELRLDELKARAGGTSPKSVPAEVGLISRDDVVMDSQAHSTIPLVVEGAPKLSLSVPTTTRITIDVSRAIGAHASYLESEA